MKKCISIFGIRIGEIELDSDEGWYVLDCRLGGTRYKNASTGPSFSAIFAFEGLCPG